jgi:hypothetical protein
LPKVLAGVLGQGSKRLDAEKVGCFFLLAAFAAPGTVYGHVENGALAVFRFGETRYRG